MLRKIAIIISYLFHPLFIPLITYILILNTNTYYSYFLTDNFILTFLSIIAVFTVVIPLISLLIMREIKIISSIYLDEKSERIFPLIVIMISFFSLYQLLKQQIPFIHIFNTIPLILTTITIITTIITYFYKISLHSIGIGGLTGILLSFYYVMKTDSIKSIIFIIIIGGVIMSARLILNKHTFSQTIIGYITGLSLAAIINLYMLGS